MSAISTAFVNSVKGKTAFDGFCYGILSGLIVVGFVIGTVFAISGDVAWSLGAWGISSFSVFAKKQWDFNERYLDDFQKAL